MMGGNEKVKREKNLANNEYGLNLSSLFNLNGLKMSL